MDQAGGHKDHAFVADLYDRFPTYRDRTDLDFFVGAAEESGGPVLELGCGTGRVLIPTARAAAWSSREALSARPKRDFW